MKEAFWGVLIIVLGLFGVVVVNLFQNVTVDNDRVYYLIKESTEASAYDAIDLTYYRLSGDIRMVEDKFIENLTRRFAENVTIGNYQIVVFDVNEIPPKVSLGITSGITSLRGEKFNIQNRVDGVIETKYTLDEILDFLGITEEEWNNYKNKANPSSSDGSGKCNLGIGSDDNATCISGDILFTGFGGTSGLKKSYCQTDTLPSNVARTANYKECNCGKWEDKSDIVYSNPTKTGRVGAYTWNFNKISDVRTVHESITEKVNIDICTTSIAIQTPKDKDQIKPSNNLNQATPYADCPADGIRIPLDTQVKLQIRYDPPNATNRRMEAPDENGILRNSWKSIDETKVKISSVSQPGYLCPLNSNYTNCIATAVITANGIGTSTISATTTNNKTGICKVTVWDGTPDTIKCENITILNGASGVIKSSYTPKNSSKTNFTFTSSDASIASISGNTITGKKTGKVTITMKEPVSGKTTTCTITVDEIKQTAVFSNVGGSGGNNGYWKVTGKDGTVKTFNSYDAARAYAAKADVSYGGTATISVNNGYGETKYSTVSSSGNASGGTTDEHFVNGSKAGTSVKTTITAKGVYVQTTDKNNHQTMEYTPYKTGGNTAGSTNYSGGGGGGSGSCFISGTKVETINGPKNIEKIEIGEKVLSYNEKTNTREYKTVEKTFIHDDNVELIYKIIVGDSVIEATGNHPFYVDGEYKEAKELKVGDKLLNKDGKYVEITAITSYESDALVYNIQVEDNHNYYVENYLVHNKSAQTGSANSPGNVMCFLAGTKVETINGPKNIEEIEIGEKVLSYNEKTNAREYKSVEKTFIHDDNVELIYKITVGDSVIEATGNHPFYVDGEYKEAKKLKVGDKLLNKDGKYVEITAITSYESDALVYNIQVEDNHNYYVENYLVHNKGGSSGGSSGGRSGGSSGGGSGGGSSGGGGKYCLVEGTKITLANGTTKNIEDITYYDLLSVWSYDTGSIKYEYPAWIEKVNVTDSYQKTTFSDGTTLKTVGYHGVFSVTHNEFISVDDYDKFKVGTKIYKVDNGKLKEVSVIKIEEVKERVKYYHVESTRYYNIIADNVITVDGNTILSNLYGFDKNLTWPKNVRNNLLDNLYTYDELKDTMPYYMYVGFRAGEAKNLNKYGVDIEAFKHFVKTYLTNEKTLLKVDVDSNGNRLWRVTTSNDMKYLSNVKLYKEGATYVLPKAINNFNKKFVGWYNMADGKIYKAGDMLVIHCGTHFEAVWE